jgi:serine/threonine-protein kinase
VCVGLEHAHGLGIIHRDIKPANIVVQGEEGAPGFAKILDLGIAATEGDAELDGNVLYGTPEYMAPEQILAQRIDGRVDLYALGVTLFELLTGRVPFTGSSLQFVLAQQLTAQVPPLAEERPDLPELAALQALLDSCLAKDPELRVKSARALREASDQLLARLGGPGSGGGALRSEPPIDRKPTVAPRRRKLHVYVIVLGVLVAAAFVAWRFFT